VYKFKNYSWLEGEVYYGKYFFVLSDEFTIFYLIFKKRYRTRSVLKICILNTIFNFRVLLFLKNYWFVDNKFLHISTVPVFMFNYFSVKTE